MGVTIHPLPAHLFPKELQPYIQRFNRELRDLGGLEGVLNEPIQSKRSDSSIARRSETQVDISRITPEISQFVESGVTGPAASTVGNIATWANTTGTSLSDGGVAGAQIVTAASAWGSDARVVETEGAATRGVTESAVAIADIVTVSGLAGSSITTASAVIADNVIVRGDGGSRGLQGSSLTLNDTGDVTNPGSEQFTKGATSTALFENIVIVPSSQEVVRIGNKKALVGTALQGVVEAVYRPTTQNWTSRLEGNQLTLGESASGAFQTFKIDWTVTDPSPYFVSLTAYHNTALRFFAGQDGGDMGTGAAGIGFYCDGSDGGAPAANDAIINFEKNSADATGLDFVNFTHTGAFGSSSHWAALNGAVGVTGGFTQVGRLDRHSYKVAQYLDSSTRWQKVDGLIGGGFGFIDAGLSEPVN